MQQDDNTTEPFQGFLSQEGNEVTVEYYPETKKYKAVLFVRYEDLYDKGFFISDEVMSAEAPTAAQAVLKLQAIYNRKHGGPSAKLSKRVRKQYEPLTDGQLITMAEGLNEQSVRYARAGDAKEAIGVARELERLCVILEERGLYEAWFEPRMAKAVFSMDELLGHKRDS